MFKEITVPEAFIRVQLTVVAVRTEMILNLSALSPEEKRLSIDDMINRQMEAIRVYCAVG